MASAEKLSAFFQCPHWFFQGAFHPLQLGDNDHRDDDKQKPRADFADMDERPGRFLVRVLPSAEEGRDVFRNPDEDPDQQKRQDQWHLEGFLIDAKRHDGAEEN